MRVARCGVAVVAALLVVAAATLVAAPTAVAGIVPGPPTALDWTVTTHSADLTWAPPLGPYDVLLTGFVVTRSGPRDAVGTIGVSAVVGARTRSFHFDDLVPGLRYTVGVAAVYRSETGPPATRVVAPDTRGLPRLLTSELTATAPTVRHVRRWDDLPCGSVSPLAQCGHVDATITTQGYTAATAAGIWDLTADVTRTFGCTSTATGVFTAQVTRTDTYDLGDRDGRVHLDPDRHSVNSGRYDFYHGAPVDVPRQGCPAGSFVSVSASHLSNVTAWLYGDYLADTGALLLRVIQVPGTADAPPAD